MDSLRSNKLSSWILLIVLTFSIIRAGPAIGSEMTTERFKMDTINIEDLRLSIDSTDSQEIVFTDNDATHFTMESSKAEGRKWHGLVHRDINYLTNIWFTDGDRVLDEEEIQETVLFPDRAEFNYKNGAKETIFMPINKAGIIFEFSGTATSIRLKPTFAMRIDYYSSSGISDYTVKSDDDGTLYIKTEDSKWIAITANVNGTYTDFRQLLSRNFIRDDIRKDGSSYENVFSAGTLDYTGSNIIVAAAIANTESQAKINAKEMIENLDSLKQEKREYLSDLINDNYFFGELEKKDNIIEIHHSYAWALISLDKLKMKRFGEGTYAGLHWFDDYWGRDTFISLRGSTLVTGDWEFAKNTIRTMAALQLNDSGRYEYGRVPNRVSLEGSQPDYSTTDGVGWFVKSIGDFVKLTGDLEFAEEIYENVILAINGESSRLDGLGFVTHQARETWMDAMTNTIIWTPRDNRAVEIQALLYQIYDTAVYLSKLLNKDQNNIDDLIIKRDHLLENIRVYFWDAENNVFYDHLNPDNSTDDQLRPNQFLALSLLPGDFLNADEKYLLVEGAKSLITEYGIRTLDPQDNDYRPTHDGGIWHHDAAYHNGDTWPWLSGATIELLLETNHTELAINLISVLNTHVLEKNPVGGIGEIFDGDSVGDGESVGALLQLWSMAEYIRILSHGLVSYNPSGETLRLEDNGLKIMKMYTTSLKYKDGKMMYTADKLDNAYKITLSNIPTDFKKIILSVPYLKHEGINAVGTLEKYDIVHHRDDVSSKYTVEITPINGQIDLLIYDNNYELENMSTSEDVSATEEIRLQSIFMLPIVILSSIYSRFRRKK